MAEQDQVPTTRVPDEDAYTVVVGVSATSKSPAALRWAAAQVEQNHGRLIAVRALRTPSSTGTTSGIMAARTQERDSVERSARRSLAADVAEVLGEDHRAILRLVRGGDRQVLLDQAKGADLLVIDAPRRLTGEPLFSQRLVGAASCPVLVMPPAVSEQQPGVVERVGRAVGRAAVRSAGTAGRAGYRPPLTPGSGTDS